MKIIRAGRGQGKTTELIKKSNEEWKHIICADRKRVKNIVKMAEKMGLDIPYPITISELPLSKGQKMDGVLIDDIEDILQYLIDKRVDYVTTSCEVIHLERGEVE